MQFSSRGCCAFTFCVYCYGVFVICLVAVSSPEEHQLEHPQEPCLGPLASMKATMVGLQRTLCLQGFICLCNGDQCLCAVPSSLLFGPYCQRNPLLVESDADVCCMYPLADMCVALD